MPIQLQKWSHRNDEFVSWIIFFDHHTYLSLHDVWSWLIWFDNSPVKERKAILYVCILRAMRHFKGIWNEKILLFERTFEVIKIALNSCRVFHFILEIFGFVWYINNSTAYVTLHNDFLGNQEYHWGCRTKSLKTVNVCLYPLALNQQTLR